MNIAVIADIHGNAPALQAVLRALDARRDIRHIYCLGDMIGIGPDTDDVLDLLFARSDISIVTGNHDEAIVALSKGEPYPSSHAAVKAHHQWLADRLSPSHAAALDNLPRMLCRTIEGHSFVFVHYSMEQAKSDAPIHEDPFSPIVEPTCQHVSELFRDWEAEVICFGHHHPVHHLLCNDTIYLNPGSLGCSVKSTAPYAIVHVERGSIHVRLEEAAYDKTSFLASYEQLQVPDRAFILPAFHGVKR